MTTGGRTELVRALSPREAAAFQSARLRAATEMPYFSHALFAVQPVAAPGLRTFGVDRHWRLYMDPALLDGPDAWPVDMSAAVLLHEACHLIRDHAGRREPLPAPVSHLAWNLAGDGEINDDLLAAGAALPGGAVTPQALGLPERGVAEDYYELLLGREQEQPGALAMLDDEEGGCGSGSGGPALPGEQPWDPAAGQPGALAWEASAGLPGLGPAEGSLVRRAVAMDVRDAEGRARGTMPAGLDRWASQVLAPPAVPWQEVLRGAVRGITTAAAGRVTFTYRRPSRRRVPGVILPGMQGVRLAVAVVVDTSGSMGQDRLDAALSEIGGVLSAGGVSRDHLHVLACDAAAGAPQRVRSVTGIRLTGGGGTDMRVGISAAAALRPKPSAIIVLTDGDTPWPDRPPGPRLLCAVISAEPPRGTPEWAVTVHVPSGPARRSHSLARGAPPALELA